MDERRRDVEWPNKKYREVHWPAREVRWPERGYGGQEEEMLWAGSAAHSG